LGEVHIINEAEFSKQLSPTVTNSEGFGRIRLAG